MEDTTGQGHATQEATNDAPIGAGPTAAELVDVGLVHVALRPSEPIDTTPTRAEAREMFKENPGLWSVVTTTGPMTRDEC